ncbi:CAP domain-containing protein [Lewinella sp. LCG006]|uniref:CAP domain-containing protein n=1 Tax=Lewinella sp. LCG006 TaxID=3231911 RepID=UPI00345FD39E
MLKQSVTTNNLRLLPLLLFGLLFFTACEPDEIFMDDASPVEIFVSNDAPIAFQQMLAEVNALRAEGCRCGNQNMPAVGPLQWNSQLAAAASSHSEDMARVGQLNHAGSDGSNAGNRLERVGYSWQQYGENIASGFTSSSTVLQAWINSPGHCRNLMGANFTEMGAARKDNYWTQVFARPR